MDQTTSDNVAIALCVTGAFVVIALVTWWMWPTPDRWSIAAKEMRAEYLDDSYCGDDEEADLRHIEPSRVIRIVVAQLRAELGLLGDTPANRLVVSDVARKFMRGRNMRPSHISRMFSIAVEVYFMHSSMDEELRLIRKSSAYQRMRRTAGSV